MINQTLRQLTADLASGLCDRLTAIVDRDGKSAALRGYPVFADTSGFTTGSVIAACTQLYLNAKARKDPRTGEYRDRLLRSFRLLEAEDALETWGKLSVLNSLLSLKEGDELSLVPADTLALFREKTDCSDFVDSRTMKFVKPLPSNYYHVAMECAGMRELLGWEADGASNRFMNKMLAIMKEGSRTGWMDEAPPHGRFDSYSVGMNLTMSAALTKLGKPVPDFINANIRRSAEMMFALRNRNGYGFSYGRSISMFGESTVVSHLLYAIEKGWFTGADAEEALAFCLHATDRIASFWYDSGKDICNIWLDGRATESYRGIHRVFEVSMSLVSTLTAILRKAESAGLADRLPAQDIGEREEWELHKSVFADGENYKRAAYVLRYGRHSFMLPLIGLGSYSESPAYYPFPHEPMFLETPPAHIMGMPFLVPKARLTGGDIVMPVEYYEWIREEAVDGGFVITAKGRMSKKLPPDSPAPCEASAAGFTARYHFTGSRIRIEYEMEDTVSSKILFAWRHINPVTFPSAASLAVRDVSECGEFHTPSGALLHCCSAEFTGGQAVCEIELG